jgi:hypothetical protein
MYKKVLHYTVVVVLLLFFVGNAFASGGKRNGTAGAQELLIPVSARGLALSGAYVAGMEGLDAIFYNPAGVGVSPNSADAMFSYMNYIADIGFSFAAVAAHMEGFGTLGFSVRTFDFGDIPITTETNPYGTGATFSPTYVTTGITYSNALTDRIRVGTNINIVSETIMNTSATGVSFDAGIQYQNLGNIQGLQIGIAVKNLGPQMTFEGSDLLRKASENQDQSKRGTQFYEINAASFELPSQLKFGVAYERSFTDDYKAVISASFLNANFANDEYALGGEFAFRDLLYVRAGYTYVQEAVDLEEEYLFGPTFGAGVNVEGALNITVDYAYRWARYFDANHMITVNLGI